MLLVCRLKYQYNCFSSHFCFLDIIVPWRLLLFVMFPVTVFSLSLLFICSLLDVLFRYRYYIQSWGMLFLLLFLRHIHCLCHFLDVKPYALSGVFLFPGPFVKVLLVSTLRMIPSILQVGQPKYLSLWLNFCYIIWFRLVFSFSELLFFIFSFITACLIESASNIPKYL